jgi:hypothetical protein
VAEKKKKHIVQTFDPETIPLLLEQAKAGDGAARHQLMIMFQRLIATLVNVCLTGKVNPRSSYQRTFLRYFGKAGTPTHEIALMMKKRLSGYDQETLFMCGQVAILEAIDRCKANLASTITICFKEEIANLLDSADVPTHTSIDALHYIKDPSCFETELHIELYVESLTQEEQDIVNQVIAGEKVKIPKKLKIKLKKFLQT